IALLVLAHGADANADAGGVGHALEAACERGQTEVVRALLRWGADVGFEGGRGGSALVIAARKGYTKYEDMARMLLESGADANISGARWFHPLNLAAYSGNKAIVHLLLKHGSNPSARGPVYGDNALQAAVQSGSIDMVRVLLRHGAETKGSGALQAACGAVYPHEGNLCMVKLLLDYGADPNDESDAYACTGYINALSGGPGSSFWSALEVARRGRDGCNDVIIKLLLDCGARDRD
ncbi:ankyrin, partial [Karstenula rhodostoma CBS 690.94]